MRQIEVLLDNRLMARKQIVSPESTEPRIQLKVDGVLVSQYNTAPSKFKIEPGPIGSQVYAHVYGVAVSMEKPVLCTKIGPGKWVFETPRTNWNPAQAHSAVWSNMAVTEIVGVPDPEPFFPDEPAGVGAIIQTDNTDCDEDGSIFVKSAPGLWVCQSCWSETTWDDLNSEGDLAYTVIREGLKIAEGVEK